MNQPIADSHWLRDRLPPDEEVIVHHTQPRNADAIQVGGTHYKDMPMQPWDVMQAVMSREEFVGFLKGNIIKYSMRAGQKAGASDDGEKAKHYRQKLFEITGETK